MNTVLKTILVILLWANAMTLANAQCLGFDDFNDTMRDPMRWGADITDNSIPSQSLETGGRLQFAGSTYVFRPWICSYGSYTADWEVIADVNLGEVELTEGHSHIEVFLSVANLMDTTINYGIPGDHMAIALDLYRDNAGTVERSFESYHHTNWVEIERHVQPLTETRQASFRLTFTASTKVLSTFYDGDGATNGYSWTALRSATIDHPDSDWEMDDNGLFGFSLGYSCSGFVVEASHEVWADNFRVNGGMVTVPVLSIAPAEDMAVLLLTGDTGRRYAIEYKTSLDATTNWQTLTTVLLTNSPQAQADATLSDPRQRFYRARLIP